MGYDEDRVDEMTLALMHLVKHRQRSDGPLRAWKGFDWDTLDRLHEKGFISDPKSKAKSVRLTEEGAEASLELFEEFFVEDGEGREEGSEGDERIVDPEWRDRE
ncbi:MAG: DUF6429 family protein, partial [Bradymonadaceae bacterium]